MRTKLPALAAVGLIALSGMSACTDDDGGGTASGGSARGGTGAGKVGVILPDTTTSQRWGTDDPKLLQAAFDAADVPVDIQNAQGDKAQFQRIADSMIAGGVKVIMIVNLMWPRPEIYDLSTNGNWLLQYSALLLVAAVVAVGAGYFGYRRLHRTVELVHVPHTHTPAEVTA